MSGVYKRDGYALFQSLPISCSTCAVHGGYHFQQTGGNDVQLWGNDVELAGSVNDATFVKLATGTVSSTWQCTDNLGFAYCVDNSANDQMVKTDGSVANTTYVIGIPSGTIITSTPLQLVLAGVSNNISTIYISANNNFANFTTGPLPTDPYTEIINAPGSRITHLGYYFGKLFWWKDQSFGYLSNSNNQNTVTVTIVSNQIGTLDNSSAFWNPTTYESPNNFSTGATPQNSGNPYFNESSTLGGIFFRGQDNHIYQYDGYTLTRLTRIIGPTITTANRRKANAWTQTTQSDFASGSIVPTTNLSTSLSPGNVTVSSFSNTDRPPAKPSGALSSNIRFSTFSITLSTADGNIANNGFESGSPSNWSLTGNGAQVGTIIGVNCTTTPRTGSKMLEVSDANASCPGCMTATVNLIPCNSNGVGTFYSTTTIAEVDNACSWVSKTLSSGGSVGKAVQVYISYSDTSNNSGAAATSDCFIQSGTDMTFYTASDQTHVSSLFPRNIFFDDVTSGSDTINSGFYTSQIFNTGFTSSTAQIQANWTVNTSTPSFALMTSTSNNGPWTTPITSTNTNSVVNQYLIYTTTISVTQTQNALTSISTVTIVSESTGTYYSAVNNSPNLTSWGTFTLDQTNNGISSMTYYVRSSTGIFTILSSTPAWHAQTINSQVNYSTGNYTQMKGDFYISAASETPTLNNFTFNWSEGSASDKAYITYFQDAIWVAESSGTSVSTDDVIYYLDLVNNAWLQFNIPANGFVVENNTLYYGDPIQGRIFKYGSVTTDNALPITSYWKSKDFTGDNPTVQNEFIQSDFIFNVAVTTITYTYSTDQVAQTAVSLPLTDNTASLINRGLLLAPGKIGTFYNFKIGDASSLAAWKLMLHRVHYNPLNWRPRKS